MNINAKEQNTYDAIVIGSGISGGYAAMELCTKGYKTLVLERGRMVNHGEYPTEHMDTWDFPNNGAVTAEEKAHKYFKQNRLGWWVNEENKHWINRDDEYDYEEIERFDWIRGHHVGGRSIMWGRHCYRWSDLDFEANKKEGIAVDWPLRYKDIEPWYDYVETFVGIAGQAEGLPQVPDGKFLKPFPLNCMEERAREKILGKYPDRLITPGRVANLSEYDPNVHKGTRGQCQARNRCWRGCSFGAPFSSLSSTLAVAAETGNMTLKANSIVHEIMYDSATGKATGVRVTDSESMEQKTYTAKIIFCNASTVGSTAILLNSKSDAFPNGLGNQSGELGHNMMDHHYGLGAFGSFDGLKDKYYYGRKPGGIYIPRFRNINSSTHRDDYLRGFGYQGESTRSVNNQGRVIGKDLKQDLFKPGPWNMWISFFGEMLAYHENRMFLHAEKKDKFGVPTIVFDAKLRENEMKMREDGLACAIEMLDAAGLENISSWNEETAPGACIHEMGTARMGRDSDTSVLNKWNQIHTVPNVFVTDGACMTSSGTQNPSITYMALTARAVDYADKQIKAGAL